MPPPSNFGRNLGVFMTANKTDDRGTVPCCLVVPSPPPLLFLLPLVTGFVSLLVCSVEEKRFRCSPPPLFFLVFVFFWFVCVCVCLRAVCKASCNAETNKGGLPPSNRPYHHYHNCFFFGGGRVGDRFPSAVTLNIEAVRICPHSPTSLQRIVKDNPGGRWGTEKEYECKGTPEEGIWSFDPHTPWSP